MFEPQLMFATLLYLAGIALAVVFIIIGCVYSRRYRRMEKQAQPRKSRSTYVDETESFINSL